MTDSITPYDIMRYERFLTERLSNLPDFEGQYREFERNRREKSGPVEYVPLIAHEDAHPLFNMLFATREAIDDFLLQNKIEVSNRVSELIHIGRAFDVLEGVDLVDGNKESTGEDFIDYYIEKLWKEADLWDMFFELEMAALMHESGMDVSLVKEGQKGGPDILLEFEDSRDVWVECKRKRLPEVEREYRKTTQRLYDKVHETVDVGDGVYAVRVSGEAIRESDFDSIAVRIAELIDSNQESAEVESNGRQFHIKELKHTEDPMVMDFPLLEDRHGPARMSDVQAFADGLGLNVDSSDDFHVDGPVEVTPTGETVVSECLAVALDIPRSIDYESWIMNSVKRAKKDLSGHGPSVAFIDVPAQQLADMHGRLTEDHRGEEVTYYERIGQRMGGVFKQSGSINGIIMTTKLSDPSGTARGTTSYWNNSPDHRLSSDMREALEQLVATES